MSLAVRPNFPRGEQVLDPLFYSSAPFVDPFRVDIEQLLQAFKAQYTASLPPRHVFSLFKDLWKSTGWSLLHLAVLEDIDRDAFTLTVFRLFLGLILRHINHIHTYLNFEIERIKEDELPIIRVGALFGLYISYYTQPKTLRTQAQIPIPIGQYPLKSTNSCPHISSDTYASLPKLFIGPADFSYYTTYVLDRLSYHSCFLILPPSHIFPYNPRNLPHAVLVAEKPNKKKAGRKSKKEKGQIAIAGIKALEGIVEDSHDLDIPPDEAELSESYESIKQRMMASLPDEAIRAAELAVTQKLQAASLSAGPNDFEGMEASSYASNDGRLLKVNANPGDNPLP
jgi:hypothetical protein